MKCRFSVRVCGGAKGWHMVKNIGRVVGYLRVVRGSKMSMKCRLGGRVIAYGQKCRVAGRVVEDGKW